MKTFTTTPRQTALAIAVSAGLCATMLVATPSDAAPAATSHDVRFAVESYDAKAADLQRGLELIDEIPYSVLLAGDAALQSWMATNHPELLKGDRADVLGCTAAIAWLIASTAIPVAKILKIKKAIDTLGGVAKAVKLFWGAGFAWEKIKALGGAAAALAAELTGVAGVADKCFS